MGKEACMVLKLPLCMPPISIRNLLAVMWFAMRVGSPKHSVRLIRTKY
jgi:hypothetical protein